MVRSFAPLLVTGVLCAETQPNFLFVLMDDWGIGDIGFYGNKLTSKAETPNVDRFAREGVVFTNGFSASSVCSPSRTAWMTGRFPAEVGVHSALPCEDVGCAVEVDPDQFATVTKLLHGKGYRVGHFGKWHMGSSYNSSSAGWLEAHSPDLAYGIHDSVTFDSNANLCVPGDATQKMFPNSTFLIEPPHPKNKQWNALTSTAVVNETLRFVDETMTNHPGKPWYANAWFHTAHFELDPTQDQLADFDVKKACGTLALNSGQTTCAQQIYWAAMKETDVQFGRLVDGLKDRGVWENTYIAFSADNGPETQYNHAQMVGSAGPFRGQKRSLYDGGIRMPFILSAPGRGPLHGRVDTGSLVSAVDWLPTVLALAGVQVPKAVTDALRGHDISATFVGAGKSLDRPETKPLLWEWRGKVSGHCTWQAPQLAAQLSASGYKLLMDPPGTPAARVELYSRAGRKDLAEMQNLAEYLPDEVEKLKGPLLEFYASVGSWPGDQNQKLGCAGDDHAWPLGLEPLEQTLV